MFNANNNDASRIFIFNVLVYCASMLTFDLLEKQMITIIAVQKVDDTIMLQSWQTS